MLKIFKFELDLEETEVRIPGFVRIISVESQRKEIVMYALVETSDTKSTFVPYKVFATGGEVVMIEEMDFKTVKLFDDNLIFHVMTGKDYWVAYDGEMS